MRSANFLRTSAALATAAALVVGAGALAGCSADASDAAAHDVVVAGDGSAVVPRVARDLHLVLPAVAADARLELRLAGQTVPVSAHTSASRSSVALRAAGEPPTHVARAAAFSTAGPQTYQIVAIGKDGLPHMVMSGVHLPGAGAQAEIGDWAVESAKSLVFQDPSLATVDTDAASRVMKHIVESPDFNRLVESIRTFGPATTEKEQEEYSGWAVTVRTVGKDGQPVYVYANDAAAKNHDASQRTVATHFATAGSAEYYKAGFSDIKDPSTGMRAVTPFEIVGKVRAAARAAVNDDLALAGKMWSVDKDVTVRGAAPQDSGVRVMAAAAEGKIDFTVDDPQFKGDRRISILKTEGRKVTFQVENSQWRRQGIMVRFRDQNKQLIAKKDLGTLPKSSFPQLDAKLPYSTFMGVVSGRYTVLGVPFEAAHKEEFEVELPEKAASFEVNVASAGLKTVDFPSYMNAAQGEPEVLGKTPAELQTLLIDVGLPAIALAWGLGSHAFELPPGKELVQLLATIGVEAALKIIVAGSVGAGTNVPALTSEFATDLIFEVIREAPSIGVALVKWAAAESAEKAIEAACGPIGGIIEAIELVGTAAQLGETIYTIANNAPFTYDRIAASETLTITVSPEKDGWFSKLSDAASAYVYYGHSTVPTVVHTNIDWSANGGNGPKVLAFTLPKQPVGGEVRVKVSLENKNGWVSAQGEAELANEPDEHNAVNVPVTVTQNPTPIDGRTQYVHDSVLAIKDGKRQFVQTSVAPATVGPQVCNTGDASRPWLCGASSMTFNDSGVLGYSWTGSGAEQKSCESGASSVIGSMAQTINVNPNVGDAEARLQRTTCGASSPVFLAFDPTGAPNGGRHVLVEKVAGKYQVYGIALDKKGALGPDDAAMSLGTFRSTALDVITLNPATGMLLGLDKTAGTVEVLKLAAAPLPVDKAPVATAVGGPGSSIGRIHDAQGVAFLPAGAGFLVLESGEKGQAGRVQAFTFEGASVDLFGGSAAFPLKDQAGANVTYTDMKIDPTESYVYVTSYVGDAPKASDYRLDIYRIADGGFVSRTTGVVGAKIAIDKWRDLYTLNYANLDGATWPEPSVSEWIAPPVEATK